MLPSELRYVEGGERRGIGKRLVEMSDESGQQIHRLRLYNQLVVLSAIPARHDSSFVEFAVLRICETDGERSDLFRRRFAHQTDDGARVDPATQECSDR